jgi:hypothetical protein
MHDGAAARQIPKKRSIPPPLDAKPYDSAWTKQPPAQDRQRMNDHLDPAGYKAVGQVPAFRQHRNGLPPARMQPARQSSQLQIRAIKPGRRVQEEDPVRNRSRRGA